MKQASLFDQLAVAQRSVKSPNRSRYKKVQQAFATNLFDLRKIYVDTQTAPPLTQPIQFVDLFSGAGGMTLGFAQAGFRPIFSVEVNEDASRTHHRNFPETIHYQGRVEQLSEAMISKYVGNNIVDVVCGGPPCQGFSVAGKRDPDDKRNVLFREFVRVVKIIQPTYVVMENVPGILTMQGGAFHNYILDAFAEAGYPEMSVAVLESAAYGVPQLRPRAIFIANRCGLPNPYPQPILDESSYLPIESAIDDLKTLPPNPASNHEWTRHSKQMEQRLAQVSPGHSLYASYFDAWKRQYPGLPAMTIKENHGGTHIHYELNRVLSAREMARLQTFPDDFIFTGTMKRAMWQIGNAVPPLLAKHIALALRHVLV